MENNNTQINGKPVADGQGKNQNGRKKVWKHIWKIAVAVTAVTIVAIVGYNLYEAMRWYDYDCISENVLIQSRDWPDEFRAINSETGQVMTKHISSYYSDNMEDLPLIRFKGGKGGNSFGYFNRATGETVIAPEYENAWDISDGIIALVDHDKMIRFFTIEGKPLHNKTFPYNSKEMDDVRYYSGHCAICDTTGLWGLIDTAGEWSICPEYTKVEAKTEDFDNKFLGLWQLTSPYGVTIADSNARPILVSGDDSNVIVEEDGTIIVTSKNAPATVYDFQGRLLYRQAYYTVNQLHFEAFDEDGYSTSTSDEAANALEYMVWDGHCGLMDLNGHVLTEALYSKIRVLGKNLFCASIYGSEAEVVLNAQGKVVE